MALNNLDKVYYEYIRDNYLTKSEYIHLTDYRKLISVSRIRKNEEFLEIKMKPEYSTNLKFNIANIVDNINNYSNEEIINKINLLIMES